MKLWMRRSTASIRARNASTRPIGQSLPDAIRGAASAMVNDQSGRASCEAVAAEEATPSMPSTRPERRRRIEAQAGLVLEAARSLAGTGWEQAGHVAEAHLARRRTAR